MLLVREVFIAKPGHAGEFVKIMKENMKGMPESMKVKILLDCVTAYNKVVVEYEVASLAEFEKGMNQEKDKQQTAPAQTSSPKYTDLYLTGRREIFKIVE